jgi:hypothetical protein
MPKNMEARISKDEMNITIASFMGYHYNAGKFYSNEGGKGNWFKEAKYHSSWDWLMPIHHAIREKAFALREDIEIERLYAKVNHQLLFGTIADVHLHAFRFIEYVNKQQSTTNDTTTNND